MSAAAEEYPVVNYHPSEYVPIDVFREQWERDNAIGADKVADPYGMNPHAGNFTAAMNDCAPLVIIVSMMVVLLNTWSVRGVHPDATLMFYLANPIMIFALTAFGVSLTSIYRKVRFATHEKNAVDYATLEAARRYLNQRYEVVPENWEERFISYLVGENVPENRFSKEYTLTVKPFKGHQVLMVANINGEAPVKRNI